MIRFYNVFILFFIVFDSYANTLCVNNDVIVIGFSDKHKPASGVYNSEAFVWGVSYEGRGVISGVASCVDFSTDDYGTNLIYQGNMNGSKCWCKITHPFESKWVQVTMKENCADNCVRYCALSDSGMLIDSQGKFRKGIFATVGLDE